MIPATHTLLIGLNLPIWVWITKPSWPAWWRGQWAPVFVGVRAHIHMQLQDRQRMWCNWLVINRYIRCSKRKKQMPSSGKPLYLSEPFPHQGTGCRTPASAEVTRNNECEYIRALVCCLAHSLHPLNGNYYLYFHLLGGVEGRCLLDLSWFPSDTEGNLDLAPGWGQSSEAAAGSDPRAWEGWVSPLNFWSFPS